jgi:hypothetical protein
VVLAGSTNVARGSVTGRAQLLSPRPDKEVMEGSHGSAVSTQAVCVRAGSPVWPPLDRPLDLRRV